MILGAQSYTVRTYTQSRRDFARAMERVAAIGYRAVQLSAVGDIPAAERRCVCDGCGLRIVLTHTAPERILNDPEGVIREHEALGCRYVGLGAMPERYRSAAWIDNFAEDFGPSAEAFRAAGLRLMYHNHNFEWQRLPGGGTLLDRLLGGMGPELMGVTLDTYWVQAAGADVCDTIIAMKDRLQCVHLKDMAVEGFSQRMAPVGGGNLPFAKILSLLDGIGTCEYALVEQDDCYGESPFDCLARSYEYCKDRMGGSAK